MRKWLEKYTWKETIFAILLFITTNPYFFWGNSIVWYLTLFGIYSLVISNAEYKRDKIGPFSLLSFFYFLVGLRYGFTLGCLYTIIIPLLLLVPIKLLNNSFRLFSYIYTFFICISVLVYFGVFVLSIPIGYSPLAPLNEIRIAEGFMYNKYPFLVTMQDDGIWMLPRFHGIYDEPGVVGTISSLILYINRDNFKKWFLLPVLVSGIISFSLFFYIALFVLLVMKLKRRNAFLIVSSVLVVAYFILQIDGIDILLTNRLEFEDGVWKGNSRYGESFGIWYDKFRFSFDYFFGLGAGANTLYNREGASYKDIIVNYGVIMFLMYISSWIWAVIKTKYITKEKFLILFFILGLIYTRPFIQSVFFIFSFLYLIYKDSSYGYYRNREKSQISCTKDF